jgi:hypothetical protein|nr:hypothetical protein [Phenylobacterium sp.]
MPSRYRHEVPRLKAEIVARVGVGEVQRAIWAEAGMPGKDTVRSWAKADAAFADALAAARRRGDWARWLVFDEGKAAAFLARVRAGERIRAVLREPGMPSRGTYEHWKATQPPFAEAVFALRQRGDARLRERAKARWRGFDQPLADRIIRGLNTGLKLAAVLAADPELPCRPVVARWRREQPEFDRVLRMIFAAWRRRPAPVPAAVVEEIVDHIVEGGSFASFSRLPGGPSRVTLRRWLRGDRDFAAAVAQACEDREEWYEDQILMTAERTPSGPQRDRERSIGRLKRHLVRLRHRPGAVHVRRKSSGEG